MDSDSESHETTGGNPSKDIILEPAAVLFLSGQSVLAEAATPTPLYHLTSDITSIPNKDSCVALERVVVEHTNAPLLETATTEGATAASPPRTRRLFYLAHPANAQYRADIPARYYLTSAAPAMAGNIRLATSAARFQRTSFQALLSAGRTAADRPLFDEGGGSAQQRLLFDVRPDWKAGRGCYRWCDAGGRRVAVEEKEDGRCKLSVAGSMPRALRDALVATWLLRLWHDAAESKQAKRECELS